MVTAGPTHKGELRRAAAKLEQVNAPVSGLVLNEVRRLGSRAYGYYGGYGSYYRQPPEAESEQPAGRQSGRRSQQNQERQRSQ